MDNVAGSGTTGIACLNTNRNFILIEKDENYFKIAAKRIVDADFMINSYDLVDQSCCHEKIVIDSDYLTSRQYLRQLSTKTPSKSG